MDLLAALLVSEEFQGIVSSAETKSSRDAEKAEESQASDVVEAADVAVDAGPVSSNPEGKHFFGPMRLACLLCGSIYVCVGHELTWMAFLVCLWCFR